MKLSVFIPKKDIVLFCVERSPLCDSIAVTLRGG